MDETQILVSNTLTNIFDIPIEIILEICQKIVNDRDLMFFLFTCKTFYSLVTMLLYHKKTNLSKIMTLPHYDNFTHLSVTGIEYNQLRKRLDCHKKKSSKQLLPSNLTNLELRDFKGHLQTMTNGMDKLKSLSLSKGCKITLNAGCIRPTVTHLTWELNQNLKRGILHEGITVLKIGYYSHNEMVLPLSLKKLYIDKTFGSRNFISRNFWRIYAGLLPEGLEVLSINCKMQIDENSLPSTLKKIYFGKKYVQIGDLPSKFPANLELFSLDGNIGTDFLTVLPDSVKKIIIGQNAKNITLNLDCLPNDLQFLSLSCPITVSGKISFELNEIFFGKNFKILNIPIIPEDELYYEKSMIVMRILYSIDIKIINMSDYSIVLNNMTYLVCLK